MRIDKYLWAVRYFKTRSLATAAINKGHVGINGKPVKASREVFPGDEISLRKDQINYQIEVLDIPPNRVGAKLVDIYRIDKTPKEAFEHQAMVRQAQDYYRAKGLGRPTKKDRREIDDYLWTDEENNDVE